MHPYLFELASLIAIFAFAIVSPGADLAMVMRQSIVHGRRAAIVTSFGIGTSLMFHVTYTILGLGLIISQSIYLFNIVKWCGVAYLVYIGIKALRAGKADLSVEAVKGKGRRRELVVPRQVAMYLIRELTTHSFPEIGRFFSDRDHSTVMYAVQKITEALDEDSELDRVVRSLKDSLV